MQKELMVPTITRKPLAELAAQSRCYYHQLLKNVTAVFVVVFLTGCVTENYRAGIKQDKKETQVNTQQATSVRVSLGLRYLQKGDFEQAKFNLSKALELSPKSAQANYAFAYYLQKTGELNLADTYYQKAISIEPNNGDTRNNYGVFLCEQQKYAQAQEQFLYATQITDYIRSASTYENLAICAQAQQNIPQALEYLSLAEHHHARPAKILALKAELQYQSGQFAKALSSLELWFTLQKPTADMLLLKHLAALSSNKLPLAYQAAQELLSTFPQSKETQWYKNDELFRCRFEQMRSEFLRKTSTSKAK